VPKLESGYRIAPNASRSEAVLADSIRPRWQRPAELGALLRDDPLRESAPSSHKTPARVPRPTGAVGSARNTLGPFAGAAYILEWRFMMRVRMDWMHYVGKCIPCLINIPCWCAPSRAESSALGARVQLYHNDPHVLRLLQQSNTAGTSTLPCPRGQFSAQCGPPFQSFR